MAENESSGQTAPLPPTFSDPSSDPDHVQRITAFLAEWNARERDIVNREAATLLSKRAEEAATLLSKRAEEAATTADTRGREAANRLAESQMLGLILQGYIQVSQASLDRAVTRGTYMTTAAGAIATAFTALLAAKFSSSAGGQPLTPSAFIPILFLGAAIVFSVAYIAFLKQAEPRGDLLSISGQLYESLDDGTATATNLDERLRRFCEWTYGGVRDRNGFLHLSVYAVAIGVVLLPIPFVRLSAGQQVSILIVGLLLLIGAFLILLKKTSVRFRPVQK
jgi:hypothetical protein